MGWHAWTRCQVPWGLAVYMLETRSEVKNVGFLLVIGVVILDAMVWGPVLLNGDVLPNQSFFESKFSICHLHLPALQSGLASLVFGLGDGCSRNGCTHGAGTSVSMCLGWELLAYGQLDRRKTALLLRVRACKDWNLPSFASDLAASIPEASGQCRSFL